MKKKYLGIMALTALVGAVLMVNLKAKSNAEMGSVENGAKAPDFELMSVNGKKVSLSDYKGKIVVLEWTNYGCPYVKKHYNSGAMQTTQGKAAEMGVVWLSVCSSAEGKQGFMSPEEWKGAIKEKGVKSQAVLLDPKGEVGRTYGAKTTPHIYIINAEGILVYQGAIDDKPTADSADLKGAKNYVLSALMEINQGKPVTEKKTKPYGCSVKY